MDKAQSPRHLLAIYDMDKTVTKRATYNGFLTHIVMNRSPWRLLLLPAMAIGLALYSCGFWKRGRLKEFAFALFVGRNVTVESLQPGLDEHARKTASSNFYKQAHDRIKVEKELGYGHMLATASFRLYVDDIARQAGFQHVIATELTQTKEGIILPKLSGQNCYGAEKIKRIEAWLAARGWAREHCHIRAYSDHVSDAPLLDYADEAFATNPHPPLRRLAEKRGWNIIDWRID